MANPHPTPRLENLRSPWQPGTSGNPAGYSQGRRISDAIENMIDEMKLERSFAATAIAMALGHKHTLKQLVKDPETGKDVWVEHKPDLAWFKMIVPRPRIEPAPQQMDAVTRLSTILDDLDSKRAAQEEQDKAAESAGPSPSGPGEWKETVQSASTLFHDVPAHAGGGQVALKAAQADLPAGDPGTTLAVERPSGQRSVPIPSALLELFNPARHAVRLMAFVDAQLAGLFTGNIRGFAAGIIRVRPRLAGGLGRALAEIAVVACLLLFHQAVVVDNQRAGGHVVQAGAVAADEQHGSQVVRQQRLEPLQGRDIQVVGQLIPDQPAGDLVAGEVVAGKAGTPPPTLVTGSTFPMLYPVLAPERPPDGKPALTVVAEQADAHPGTLVARSTFPMLYPVLAPERPPDGKPATTVVAGQADTHPRTLVTGSTFPMLYPVLAPERPPDGKPATTFLAATLSVVLLQPVAVGLLNLLRPPSKVRAQAPSVTPQPALVNHAVENARNLDISRHALAR